ncbi:SH3 domain-containing protein, partial [Cronobacter sakazakii]|uniref:SH3 domain-containing protein n=1 Tax=Cronobacter sakazakii TaxID=28141 RepID=UPI00191C7B12
MERALLTPPSGATRHLPRTRGRKVRFALLGLAFLLVPAAAAPAAPHYASLRSDKAYLREGPTYAHRVLWVYRRKGYPFVVLSAYDTWRRVRDIDGTTGWMSAAVLTDRRTVLVTGHAQAIVRAEASPAAKI